MSTLSAKRSIAVSNEELTSNEEPTTNEECTRKEGHTADESETTVTVEQAHSSAIAVDAQSTVDVAGVVDAVDNGTNSMILDQSTLLNDSVGFVYDDSAIPSKRAKTIVKPQPPFPVNLDPLDPSHFDNFLFQLLAFRVANGNFHVNREKHPALHIWMQALKKEYKLYSSPQTDSTEKSDPMETSTANVAETESTSSQTVTSKLTDQQVAVLEFYHIPLTSRGDDHWTRFYNLLVQYKERHGHCLVPRLCEVPGLGDWVTDQRRQRKQKAIGQSNQLTDEREKLLDQLGFAWQVRNRPEWEMRYQELIEYKEQYGEYVVQEPIFSCVSSTYPFLMLLSVSLFLSLSLLFHSNSQFQLQSSTTLQGQQSSREVDGETARTIQTAKAWTTQFFDTVSFRKTQRAWIFLAGTVLNGLRTSWRNRTSL